MTTRRFSNDVPSRETATRRVDVRANLGNGNYLVTVGDGTPQPARSTGGSFARGDSALGYWANSAGCWILFARGDKVLVFSIAGALTTGDKAIRLHAPSGLKLINVFATANTTPTGDDLIIDVNLNGTTIFTDQAKRPTILDGDQDSLPAIPDVTDVEQGDVLTIAIDQVGSSAAGADLVVQVRAVVDD